MISSPKKLSKQSQPSLISSLYRYWQQYKVPAIFYHYTLSILAMKQKDEQIAFMSKEIKILRVGTHPYHIITDLIASRQQSLQAISQNVDCLDTTVRDQQFFEYSQYQRGYLMIKKYNSRTGHRFIELINNIKLYRKMTMQVVSRIYQWAKQIHRNQYKGVIQFIFKHEDYLQKILSDTNQIINNCQLLFENNPLLIVKREHEKTQNELIYNQLKITEQQAKKMQITLQIITTHHAILENKRLLGIYKSSGSTKTLKQTENFDRLYGNFHRPSINVKNYKAGEIIKTTQQKNDRLIANPEIFSEMGSSRMYQDELRTKEQNSPIQMRKSTSQTIIGNSHFKQKQTQKDVNPSNLFHSTTQFDISFHFQSSIQLTEIYNYLRSNIFKNRNIESRQIEAITRNIIKYKDYLSFMKINVGNLLVGWIAVILTPQDQFFRRVADIIYLQNFIKVPALQQTIINHFISLGYGLIKQNGSTIYEGESKYRKVFNLININWQLKQVKRDRLKKVIKEHLTLKGSRLLKYYSYSTQTKYHKYCLHQQARCKVQFKFDSVIKVFIEGQTYFKVKCDNIERKGQMWKCQNRLNELHLIISKNLQILLEYENNCRNKCQGVTISDNKDEKIQYLYFPQTKCIKKYINRDQEDIIVEKLQIKQSVSQVLSISLDRKTLKNCLIVDQSYIMALICSNQQDYGKTVAIVIIK